MRNFHPVPDIRMVDEEAVYVLKGRGVVIGPDRQVEIRAGDYVSFPTEKQVDRRQWPGVVMAGYRV